MRLTLPTAIITIILYEVVLWAITSNRLATRVREVSATRQGDWLMTIDTPMWWWALAIVPPVLLLGYWAYRRSR